MISPKEIYLIFKRGLDIFGAILLLIITSPAFLLTGILVLINLGKPIFFSQPRPGLKEEVFKLYKFRSMKRVDVEKHLITDEERLTRFGKLLRSTSLDELPSLWNVIRGEMSFVGPRPLLPEYLKYYSSEETKRHQVKPGITGLAQCKGRNLLSWDQKFAYDIEYVNKISFLLDFRILLLTIRNIFKKEGITSEGHVTSQSLIEAREKKID